MKRFTFALCFLFSANILFLSAEKIYLLFDGSMNGHLLGCNCPTAPKSGLVKRAVFIRDFKSKHPKDTLLVSSGDLFDIYPDEVNSEAVVKAMSGLSYDAVAIGDQDFINGAAFLSKAAKKINYLSANISVEEWGPDKTFTPYVIREAGGLKVAIVSLAGANVFRYFREEKIRKQIKVADPLAAWQKIKGELKGKADLVILLTHQGLALDKEFAAKAEGAALILGGHSQDLTTQAVNVNGIPIFHAGQSGNWQVEIALDVDQKKVKSASAKYHFFKYADGNKPIQREAIVGTESWTWEFVIHENPSDDPEVAQILKSLK